LLELEWVPQQTLRSEYVVHLCGFRNSSAPYSNIKTVHRGLVIHHIVKASPHKHRNVYMWLPSSDHITDSWSRGGNSDAEVRFSPVQQEISRTPNRTLRSVQPLS